jgi:folate-binding protein YgfZ
MTPLTNRNIIEISGIDRKKFIQGLITNDVEKASESNLIYSAMLNAQGRFLYDFFIFDDGEKLVLDCFAERRDEILKKLNLYKLRSQVEIKKNDDLKVLFNQESKGFADPRNPELGYRLYSSASKTANEDSKLEYDFSRISLKIPESEQDLTYEKSFILEFGFDDLNAVDYKKGCYVGQELTARTHYRGEIRKKIFHVKLDAEKIEKNSEIYCEGKSAGLILSSVFYKNELHALALIKDPQDLDLTKLDCVTHKISVIS